MISIHFDNKGLEFIHENDIINCLPESPREDEIPSTVFSLSQTIGNKMFNYKNTIKNVVNTNDTKTYGTGIISCNYIF